MDEGFADYFAASFHGNGRIFDPHHHLLRDLNQPLFPTKYNACITSGTNFCGVTYTADRYYGARLFGGALWDLRQNLVLGGLDTGTIDRWIFDAISTFVARYGDANVCGRTFLNFRALLEETTLGAAHLGAIDDAFTRHNITGHSTAYCFPAPVIRGVNVVTDDLGQTATVIWNKVAPAKWHRVYKRADAPGLHFALGELVADSLADTTFTYREPDTTVVLAFVVTAMDSNGVEGPASGEVPAVTAVVPGQRVSATTLIAPFPNPTRGTVAVAFTLPRSDNIRLDIYDIAGRVVRELWSGRVTAGSEPVLRWDGRDRHGHTAMSGVYLVRLEGATSHATARVVVLP
jgi:hypothetical protein